MVGLLVLVYVQSTNDKSIYSRVFPSTTSAFFFTTMLVLSDANGKKDRRRLPVSLALARDKYMGKKTM